MPRKQVQARSQVRRRVATLRQTLPARSAPSNILTLPPPSPAGQAPLSCTTTLAVALVGVVAKVTSAQQLYPAKAQHAAVPCCLRHQHSRMISAPSQHHVRLESPYGCPSPCLCLQCLTRTESHSQPCALAHPHQQVRQPALADRCCSTVCCQH